MNTKNIDIIGFLILWLLISCEISAQSESVNEINSNKNESNTLWKKRTNANINAKSWDQILSENTFLWRPPYTVHSYNMEILKDSDTIVTQPKQNNYGIKNPEGSKWFWDFINWNDLDAWTVSDLNTGIVTGGALWLSIETEQKNHHKTSWKDQVWGDKKNFDIESPANLGIPSKKFNKIVIRLRNLSPETDGYISWRITEKFAKYNGRVRFTMKPDCKEWQEVICHMDDNWSGIIDQIKIQPAEMWQRGDIWIDWIAVASGTPKPIPTQPDVCSEYVVPKIKLPGISQLDFNDAFKILDECIITDVPIHGFNYPVMAPGGIYGENWWQLDASLNITGAKWTNQKFVESVMLGFAEVQAQNPDGRIDLWGGSPVRGQVADVSSLPRYFEAAYDVARRTHDSSLQKIIYVTMKKYLGYWFSSAKRDEQTGLITAVFEETFSNPHKDPGIIAPIALNVAVAIGCHNTSKLAQYLGKIEEAKKYANDFDQIAININKYLWNDEKHVYFNYDVNQNIHDKRLLCTTFDPLRLGIVPPDRVELLMPILLDTTLFNWGVRPVTTIARTEPDYVEATGPYDGSAWFGDVWTLRNLYIIKGLEDAGKHKIAAELTWSTINSFNANYSEYIDPSTGSGEGVERYGWTASQYIQAIIEHLFGINYDNTKKRLRINPHIPESLFGEEISISNLILPTKEEVRLELKVTQSAQSKAKIVIKISGQIPKHTLEVFLPNIEKDQVTIKDKNGNLMPLVSDDELLNTSGVRMKLKEYTEIVFDKK